MSCRNRPRVGASLTGSHGANASATDAVIVCCSTSSP